MINEVGSIYSIDTQSKGSHPGQDNMRVHYTIQNNMPFKTYGLFISRVFHLIFLDYVVTETAENKTSDKQRVLYMKQ